MENKRVWWNKNPVLILIESLEKVSSLDIPEFIYDLKNKIYSHLEEGFKDYGCKVIHYDGNYFENLNTNYAVIINPVLVGKINIEVRDILGEDRERILREKLPEVSFPFAIKRGKEICKKFNIYPELHPNFVNLIFIEDTFDFHSIPSAIKILFLRFFMAKLGAFKNIIVPYKEGCIAEDKVILGTLEGGHPSLPLKELSKRLVVFGSCKEVGGWEEIKDREIPKNIWRNSETVNSLIELGKYLGEKSLLSPPVEIKNLVKDENLAKLIIRIVNYSRQAEGAFMAFSPEIKISIPNNFYDGVFVVTCSGKYGVVKTDLSYGDLAGVIPLENRKVGVLRVEGEDVKGPSVEAEEFTIPLYEMRERYLIVKSNFKIPPIRAVVHLHRGYEIMEESEEFFEIKVDIEEYPPVGCGVDLMHEMSKYAMEKAVKGWLERERRPNFAIFNVPNHGTNIFLFWKDLSGEFLRDPFYFLKEAIEKNCINFGDVPQM